MKKALEMTNRMESYQPEIKEVEANKRFAFVLKYKGLKKDYISDFYSTKDQAVEAADEYFGDKIATKSNHELKNLYALTFIFLNSSAENSDGHTILNTTDLETIQLKGFKPVK
ncbi:MAG: hypothetical protein WD512_06625 [Candidatus Paceibacterota bacterium]